MVPLLILSTGPFSKQLSIMLFCPFPIIMQLSYFAEMTLENEKERLGNEEPVFSWIVQLERILPESGLIIRDKPYTIYTIKVMVHLKLTPTMFFRVRYLHNRPAVPSRKLQQLFHNPSITYGGTHGMHLSGAVAAINIGSGRKNLVRDLVSNISIYYNTDI